MEGATRRLRYPTVTQQCAHLFDFSAKLEKHQIIGEDMALINIVKKATQPQYTCIQVTILFAWTGKMGL